MMFYVIKKLTLATTLSAIAFTSAAYADTARKVSEIRVSASYDAAEGSNAQELLPEIATDVQLAVAKLVPTSDDAGYPTILIDIRKVALDGDTILPASTEFNQLEGVVSIENRSGAGGKSFRVNVTAVTDLNAVPEGYVGIAPSIDDFYQAMVDGFAMKVAKEFGSVDEDGNKISE